MTRLTAVFVVVVAVAGASLDAQQPSRPGTSPFQRAVADDPPPTEVPSRRGDDDEPDMAGLAFGRWLTLGGSAQVEWDTVRHPAGIAQAVLESEMGSLVQLRATVTPAQGVVFFAKTELRRSFPTDEEGWWRTGQTSGRAVEAYVDLDRPFGIPVGLRVGRQRFRDAQEWFFDEYLDAVRLRSQAGRWRFDVAITGTIGDTPPFERDTEQRRHVIATISRRVTRAMRGTAYFVRRDDTLPRHDTPWWLGASLASRGEHAVMFHATGAIRRGRTGETRLRGWATDASARWHIDARGRPALSLSYARASGDTSTDDGVDGGFRQTDLQDNSTRVGGIRRVRMYGEVFDPELSNLQILTAAASLRPARMLSIDLLAHRYHQVVARRRLADHAFDARANGGDRHLGDEVDVQVVARPAQRMELRLIVGVFSPGRAFDAVRGAETSTLVWRPQVRIYF